LTAVLAANKPICCHIGIHYCTCMCCCPIPSTAEYSIVFAMWHQCATQTNTQYQPPKRHLDCFSHFCTLQPLPPRIYHSVLFTRWHQCALKTTEL